MLSHRSLSRLVVPAAVICAAVKLGRSVKQTLWAGVAPVRGVSAVTVVGRDREREGAGYAGVFGGGFYDVVARSEYSADLGWASGQAELVAGCFACDVGGSVGLGDGEGAGRGLSEEDLGIGGGGREADVGVEVEPRAHFELVVNGVGAADAGGFARVGPGVGAERLRGSGGEGCGGVYAVVGAGCCDG